MNKIEPLENADYTLVEIVNGYPSCKKHGAMLKVNPSGVWRCCSYVTCGEQKGEKGQKLPEGTNMCRAGCVYVNKI